jgi:peptidoglycan/xylan/chitin deacetylase (PgdA/CDA1 family)
MRKLIRNLIKKMLDRIPLRFYQRLMKRDVVGFVYHSVSDRAMPHVRHLYTPVSEQRFENALLYLNESFTPITYGQLHAYVMEGLPLPPRAVYLSFDDGFVECYSVVRPLLLKYKIPCTFFVTGDWIDNGKLFYRNKVSLCIEKLNGVTVEEAMGLYDRLNNRLGTHVETMQDFKQWVLPLVQADEPIIDRVCEAFEVDIGAFLRERQPYLTRSQISQMSKEGFTIGAHTCSHVKLAQVDVETMESEIVESSRLVQEITGEKIIPFAFPNSATGIEREDLIALRKRHDFLGLFFDTKGVAKDLKFMINRVWAERRGFDPIGQETNLPVLLHIAYIEQAFENIMGILRRS